MAARWADWGRYLAGMADEILGGRSVAAVLHGRARKEPARPLGRDHLGGARPRAASEHVRDACAGLDHRRAELGEQLAAESPRWAVEAWGQPMAEPGARLEDWKQRAAVVQSYRERSD